MATKHLFNLQRSRDQVEQRIKVQRARLRNLLKRYRNLTTECEDVCSKNEKVRQQLKNEELLLTGVDWNRPLTDSPDIMSPDTVNAHYQSARKVMKFSMKEVIHVIDCYDLATPYKEKHKKISPHHTI